MNPLRIAWFTPLVGISHSAVASEYLLNAAGVSGWVQVEIFTDDNSLDSLQGEGGPITDQYPIYHHLRAFERARIQRFDARIYLYSNHPDCSFVLEAMALSPGIVFTGDTCHSRIARTGKEGRQMVHPDSVVVARTLYAQNHFGALRSLFPINAQKQGLAAEDGVFLFDGPELLAEELCRNSDLALVTPEQFSVRSLADYWAMLARVDGVIVSRFDAANESPLTAYLAQAAGKPLIVSNWEPLSELPGTLSVAPGQGEADGIIQAVRELRSSPKLREHLIGMGLNYVATACDPRAVLEDLISVAGAKRAELELADERLQNRLASCQRRLWSAANEGQRIIL